MEHEELGNKLVALSVRTTKMTADVLKTAIKAYLNHRNNPHGKMTVKQLMRKDAGAKSIEITEKNIKSFERVARKYGVDFALKKDSTQEPPKYIVFFKARDADVIEQAFKEYTNDTLNKDKTKRKEKSRPSVREKLIKFKDKLKRKERELDRSHKKERDNML